jgi:hypothetical protein
MTCLAPLSIDAAIASPRGFVKSNLALDAPAVALAFGANGILCALEGADFESNVATLRTFLPDGTPGGSYPVSGDAPDNFYIGGMAYDGFDPQNERLLISDNTIAADGRLYAISSSGIREPQPVAAGIAGIADVAVRSTGEIFVSTAPSGEAGAVLQIDRNSGASSVVLSGLGFGAGLEFDLAGNLIVQDTNAATFRGRLQRLAITETAAGLEFGPAETLVDNMQSGYGVAVDSEDDIFTTGSGGLFHVTGSPLAEIAFDGNPLQFATAVAFDPGSLPFEAFAGVNGGRLAYTADFADAFVTLLSPARSGDYNADGSVDEDDDTLWRSIFGSTTDLSADGNGDGVVDTADYVVWRRNVGAEAAGSSAAILARAPEPATIIPACVVLAVLMVNRRSRSPANLAGFVPSQAKPISQRFG